MSKKSASDNRPKKTKRLQRKNDEPAGVGHNSGTPAPEQVVDTVFPKTIAAFKNIERSTWTLGDALVDECGPPSQPGERTGSDTKLAEALMALKAVGCDYSFDYLRALRRTAANFPTGERSPDGQTLPFSYFLLAGTPENLKTAREKAQKDGVKLTADFIREMLKDQDQDEVDVPHHLAALNDELERLNDVDNAFDNDGFSRLPEQDRAELFKACKSVEAKWNKIAARFDRTSTEKKAA